MRQPEADNELPDASGDRGCEKPRISIQICIKTLCFGPGSEVVGGPEAKNLVFLPKFVQKPRVLTQTISNDHKK